MSLLAENNSNHVNYSFLQRLACNVVRYGCTNCPKHIAIVMDGNRRFAREHNFQRSQGHALGAEKLFDVCQWCYDLGINELSVYAFSLENTKRSQDEIDTLMNIARDKLNELKQSIDKIHEKKISIRIIGNLDLLPDDIQKSSYYLMNETNHYTNFILNVYLYYTSRNEITNLMKILVKAYENNFIQIDDIDDDLIIQSLILRTSQTGHFPDIFLRTSGELRLSDFMLLQCRFSMYVFANVYWPAFNIWHLYWIILQYEMKSKSLIYAQNQCQNILKQNHIENEEKNQRIKTYFNWLVEQQK